MPGGKPPPSPSLQIDSPPPPGLSLEGVTLKCLGVNSPLSISPQLPSEAEFQKNKQIPLFPLTLSFTPLVLFFLLTEVVCVLSLKLVCVDTTCVIKAPRFFFIFLPVHTLFCLVLDISASLCI